MFRSRSSKRHEEEEDEESSSSGEEESSSSGDESGSESGSESGEDDDEESYDEERSESSAEEEGDEEEEEDSGSESDSDSESEGSGSGEDEEEESVHDDDNADDDGSSSEEEEEEVNDGDDEDDDGSDSEEEEDDDDDDGSESEEDDDDSEDDDSEDEEKKLRDEAILQKKKRLEDLEAKAVAEAKASADSSFKPSQALLNDKNAQALLLQVDGPSLLHYQSKESIYVGRSIPIASGGKLTIPIQVAAPGSVVEYAVEIQNYDLGITITAERDEGVTVVKRSSRVNASDSPLTQKFLVGTVPCLINFKFDNEYSWLREKIISYKITVTPPSIESLASGRRRRAKACLKAVNDDVIIAKQRLQRTENDKNNLDQEIQKLTNELQEKKNALSIASNEMKWLHDRIGLRKKQNKLLTTRLENGWDDEKQYREQQQQQDEETEDEDDEKKAEF